MPRERASQRKHFWGRTHGRVPPAPRQPQFFAISCALAACERTNARSERLTVAVCVRSKTICGLWLHAAAGCLNRSTRDRMHPTGVLLLLVILFGWRVSPLAGQTVVAAPDPCAASAVVAYCSNGGRCTSTPSVDLATYTVTCQCTIGWGGATCAVPTPTPCANCQHSGVCTNTGGVVTCVCPPGYSNTLCQTEIDECASNPCAAAGTAECVDLLNAYSCTCKTNFAGLKCEQNLNPCGSVPAPCAKPGTLQCINSINAYTCTCVDGYTGTNCQTNINECASNPCSALGTAACVDAVNGWSCTCHNGYSGLMCETDTNECGSNPCDHGTCVDAVNGYLCQCSTGYSGLRCQTKINYCAGSPCKNGATCVDQLSAYACLCAPGFDGVTCTTNINECTSQPCLNAGTCTDGVNRFTCKCAVGFNGLRCESEIDECSSAPCANGGVCTDRVNGYFCACADGWSGVTCQSNINECASAPCRFGALCVDGINGFECRCADGYIGATCSTEANECASAPCMHGGTCIDELNYFRCNCTRGYAGLHCETDLNECASAPCLNGGTCIDGNASYRCECIFPYNGKQCQSAYNLCASTPCQNGGTCTLVSPAEYNCSCASGHTGLNCGLAVGGLAPPTGDGMKGSAVGATVGAILGFGVVACLCYRAKESVCAPHPIVPRAPVPRHTAAPGADDPKPILVSLSQSGEVVSVAEAPPLPGPNALSQHRSRHAAASYTAGLEPGALLYLSRQPPAAPRSRVEGESVPSSPAELPAAAAAPISVAGSAFVASLPSAAPSERVVISPRSRLSRPRASPPPIPPKRAPDLSAAHSERPHIV